MPRMKRIQTALRSIKTMAIGTLLSSTILGNAADNEWFQWRGADRTGRSPETGLLESWPQGGPKLAWKATGIGLGYSGPAIADGMIYVTGEDKTSGYVYALDLTGKKVWSEKLGKAGAPGWGGFTGPRATPTVSGKKVYVLGQYGELLALDAQSGKILWQKHYVKDFGGKLPEWGFSESVLVDGNKVICTPGGDNGCIVALNKDSGETIWRTTEFKDNSHYSSMINVTIDGVQQYIQLTDANLVGVAPDTGKVLWKAVRKGRVAVIPTPICSGNYVYVTSGYETGCNMFQVTKQGDQFAVKQVYANKDMVNHHGGVILHENFVYGHSDSKGWVCMELATGKMVWNEKSKLPKGSIAYADNHFYLRSESDPKRPDPGTIVLIEATSKGFVEKGRFDQPERSDKNAWPHPVISGGKLYIRDQDLLFCYDIKK
jgi:outer membrane protein assembly factor BamB